MDPRFDSVQFTAKDGTLINRQWGNDRGNSYGVGQYANGQVKMYAGAASSPATVAMSFIKTDGKFDDKVVVSKDRTDIRSGLSVRGGVDMHRKDGRVTQFDSQDNKNYIRGDTDVQGTLRINDRNVLAELDGKQNNLGADPKFNSIGRDSGDWLRINGTPANGVALANGLSVNTNGGLNVGAWGRVADGQVHANHIHSRGGMFSTGEIGVNGRNAVHLGVNEVKEQNAGKIGFRTFSGDSLDVVGAGNTGQVRNVRVYDRMTINADQSSMLGETRLKVGGNIWAQDGDVYARKFIVEPGKRDILAEIDGKQNKLKRSCRDLRTPCNDVGGGNAAFLDRHHVACSDDEMLTQFQLRPWECPRGNYQYAYRCCKLG
jgi:hypothetical protein